MGVISTIKSDLAKVNNSENVTMKDFFRWYLFPQGSVFKHDVWVRLLQACKRKKILKYTVGILVYIIEQHYTNKYGIHVNTNIDIGDGLHIVHGGSVFLNCKSIGDNVTIYPRVMCGSAHGGIPSVGSNVTIYTGAVVTGNIHVGDGCVIGANAVVNKDCEPNSFYAGVPARKINSKIVEETTI